MLRGPQYETAYDSEILSNEFQDEEYSLCESYLNRLGRHC